MRIGNRDITFLFSLCCSLLINTGMVDVVLLRAQPPSVVNLSHWHTRPSSASLSAPRETAFVSAPPEPEKKLVFDNREAFGESGATGDALNSSPGETPLEAMKGSQNQAYLGRMSGGGGGSAGASGAQAMIGAPSPQAEMTPRVQAAPKPAQAEQKTEQKARPEVKAIEETDPDKNLAEQPKPAPAQQAMQVAEASHPAPEAPPAAQAAQASPSPAQASANSPGARGAPGPRGAANPAPFSDRDSDPFSETNSFKYVNGRVSARNGRTVKTVKPQILQAGYLDMAALGNPSVTFLATVDETGNVIHVQRYRSSGSDNIDLPCEEALNQWWIEPSKDKAGKPVRDVVSITFAFY